MSDIKSKITTLEQKKKELDEKTQKIFDSEIESHVTQIKIKIAEKENSLENLNREYATNETKITELQEELREIE